ncbi:MAG TPA: cation diffusion facilitator family transporter [Candidatus Nanoarchaeia archaeon]|nr:cation diffusion facilitator family transporter [Candidatus Nanoarchaeia archaeon]
MSPHESNHEEKVLLSGVIINFVFFVVELAGGLLSNSMAVISDALHDFTDVISLFFSWWVERIARQHRHPRFERLKVVVAFGNALALIIGSLYLIFEAIGRFSAPEPVESRLVIALGILGILFNSFIFYKLLKSERKNINIRVLILHYAQDVLGWVTILGGAIIMYFTGFFWIDSAITVLYSVIILIISLRFLWQSGKMLAI